MTARALIISEIEIVAKEQQKTLAPLSDRLSLLESGLDSLCLAILVTRLEDKLGVDPFSAPEQGRFPETIGDLVAFYDGARV